MDTKFTEKGKPHLSRPRRLSTGVLRHGCQGAQRPMWLHPTFVPAHNRDHELSCFDG
jgi:hypothetical protein